MGPGWRIVHLASSREWRGGQHQVWLLATAMHRAGQDVRVITGTGTQLAKRLLAGGVSTDTVAWKAGLDPRVAVRLMSTIDNNTMVHAHDSHAHALADIVLRARRAPLVVTRRVDLPIQSSARFRRADAVIAISSAVRQRLLSARVDTERIVVIPDALPPVPANLREITPSSTPEIVCVAAMTYEKGIDVLLHAAAALRSTHPQAHWTVIGEGVEHTSLDLTRQRLGLHQVVTFASPTTPVVDALRRATLAVQPSRSEGLGSAVLQALALGIPVVASKVGGLPDALQFGGGVLVTPESPLELADAIRRLLDNDDARRMLSAAGRAAAANFSLDTVLERTMQVYRSIVTRVPSGSQA